MPFVNGMVVTMTMLSLSFARRSILIELWRFSHLYLFFLLFLLTNCCMFFDWHHWYTIDEVTENPGRIYMLRIVIAVVWLWFSFFPPGFALFAFLRIDDTHERCHFFCSDSIYIYFIPINYPSLSDFLQRICRNGKFFTKHGKPSTKREKENTLTAVCTLPLCRNPQKRRDCVHCLFYVFLLALLYNKVKSPNEEINKINKNCFFFQIWKSPWTKYFLSNRIHLSVNMLPDNVSTQVHDY